MKKDIRWKEFFSDNRRYADLINGVACGGQQLVMPEDLQEVVGAKNSGERDLLRKVALGVNFAIVGIENQEEIDYRLPARIMYYDATEYWEQLRAIGKMVQEGAGQLEPGEFLYRFRKEDRLSPVMTFALYAGEKEWDGATELREILSCDDMPEKFRELIGNYKVNFINIRNYEDTELFQTDVKQVFEFIRWSKDREKLKQLVNSDISYRRMKPDAVALVQNYANMNKLIDTEEYKVEGGRVDMCKALQDWAEEERTLGREEGERNGILKMVAKFLMNGGTEADAMKMLEVTEEEIALARKYC